MNKNTNVKSILAYRLVPGRDTYQGGKVLAVSGPHMMPKGRCVKVTFLRMSPLLKTLVREDEYVLTLALVPQV